MLNRHIAKTLAFWIITLFSLPSFASSDIQPKIVGGLNASLGYSWMVSIEYYSERGQETTRQHFCGGALIHEEWVLTAAHCLVDEQENVLAPEQLVLLIGKKDISIVTHETHSADSIIIHEDYLNTETRISNDIALIKLAAPALEAPINLASKSLTDSLDEDTLLNVAGWGDTDFPVNLDPTVILHEVQVPLRTQDQCTEAYEEFDGTLICTGEFEGGVSPCFGDSGGPLFTIDNGYHQHLGIVSFGVGGCALPGGYEVYTKTASFENWINSKMGVDSGGEGGSIGWLLLTTLAILGLRSRHKT